MNIQAGELYTLENGDLLYFQPRTRRLYEIPKDQIVRFNAFRQRFIIALAAGAILYSLIPTNWLLCAFIAVVFYASSTYAYFKQILPPLLIKENAQISDIKKLTPTISPAPKWAPITITIIGAIIILSSFYIPTQVTERLILIAFGAILVIGGSQALLSNKK